MTLHEHAAQLAAEWADHFHTLAGERETSLALFVLTQLADPASDYGFLLADLCERRYQVGRTA